MNTYNVLLVSLNAIALVTFLANIFQLVTETKRLKEEGQTPLMGRNISVVLIAFFVELLVIFGVMYLFNLCQVTVNPLTVTVMFLTGYFLRNFGAYCSTWALWSLFVRIDRRKMQKELDNMKDGEKAL